MRSFMSNHTMSLVPAMRRQFVKLVPVLAVLTLAGLPASVRADLIVAGDTSPAANTISDAGGPIGADLIIGDTGVAGLFMDSAPPLFGVLMPIESPNGIIGNQEGSIGAATLEDFGGGEWIVTDTFTLGNAGQGFLDLFDSALVQADTFIVGSQETGDGLGTINGQGTRIITDSLTVGDAGTGQLEITDRGILVSGNAGGDSIIGNSSGGVGIINLTDVGSRWNVGTTSNNADLIIGNGSGVASTGQGTLNIDNRAIVQVAGNTFINRNGRVNLTAGGRLRTLSSSNGDIFLNGVLAGDGFVDGPVAVLPLGQIRNAAGVANTREKLVFSGPVLNDGTIEILGGEMDFNATLVPLINNFEVVVRDGVMRFPAGMDNFGTVTIGGNTTLHGPIVNSGGGSVFVLSGSESLVVGDLTFSSGSPSSVLSLAIGSSPGTLDVTGSVDLGTTSLLALNYTSGLSSMPGDTYQIMQSPGGITGTFMNIQASADGRLWDINYFPNSITVTATAVVAAPVGADFNGDGIVDQLDLIIWQNNYGRTSPPSLADAGDADGDGDVDGRDLLIIQQKFGGPPLVAAVNAVPEPSSLALLACAALGLVRRRAPSCEL